MPFFLLLSVLLVVADQIVKLAVRANIDLGQSIGFLPGMDLTFVCNTGAAFSVLNTHTWVLTLVSAVVSVILLVVLLRKMLPDPVGMLSISLLLGGAVGNLIDRAMFGYVTDMFKTTFMNFAVFNVADIGVTVGAVLLCVDVLLLSGKRGEEK